MSPDIRAIVAADAVLAHPESGAIHVRLAIESALTDYRRAFVRRLVAAGVSNVLVWKAMGSLPLERAMPVEEIGPLSPSGEGG
jgi:hypothetical protein